MVLTAEERRQHRIASQKKYDEKNKYRIKSYREKYYQENTEKKREYSKEYSKKNRKKLSEALLAWRHKKGISRSMRDATDCSAYLGIHIAEGVLSRAFGNYTRMPHNNPGYDFLCGKLKKIDVKASCERSQYGYISWRFRLKKNSIPDYFLCIGFDNRKNLNPLHVWLIPGNDVNTKELIAIFNTEKGLKAWSKYERPIEDIVSCCDHLKQMGEKVDAVSANRC